MWSVKGNNYEFYLGIKGCGENRSSKFPILMPILKPRKWLTVTKKVPGLSALKAYLPQPGCWRWLWWSSGRSLRKTFWHFFSIYLPNGRNFGLLNRVRCEDFLLAALNKQNEISLISIVMTTFHEIISLSIQVSVSFDNIWCYSLFVLWKVKWPHPWLIKCRNWVSTWIMEIQVQRIRQHSLGPNIFLCAGFGDLRKYLS